MSPRTKYLFLFFFTTFFAQVFSQEALTPMHYYEKGEQLVNKDFPQAFSFFMKGIEQSKQGQDWKVYLKFLNQLAKYDRKLNNDRITQVFGLLKESLKIIPNENRDLTYSQLHFNVGLFYQYYSYQIDSALHHYYKANEIRISFLGEEHEEVAQCYHALGDIYKYYKREFLNAEECYERALQIREHNNFSDLVVLAQIYYNLATTNRSQRDFEKAISYGIKTIELLKTTQNLDFLERTYNALASTYRDMGQSAIAKEYYLKAIQLNIKSKNSPGPLATYYMNYGETLKNDSLYKDALTNFLKARSLYNQLKDENKLNYIYCVHQMAGTFLLMKDYKNALKTYRELQSIVKKLGLTEGTQVSDIYRGLGGYFSEINQLDSSLNYYQKALISSIKSFHPKSLENPSIKMIGASYSVYPILIGKAETLKKMFNKSGDIATLFQSLDCLILSEKLLTLERNTLDMEDSKWKFLDKNYDVYEQIISTLYKLNQINPADSLQDLLFFYFEQSKSRSLSETLSEVELAGNINLKDSLFRKQNDLKKAIYSVEHQLAGSLNQSVIDSMKVNALRNQLIILDREIQKSNGAIEQKFPGYFRAKYAYKAPDIKEIQRQLNREQQVIVEYFFGTDSIYGLAISSDAVAFKSLGETRLLQQHLMGYLKHFYEDHPAVSKEAFKTFVSSSYQLYKSFIGPFRSLLSERSRLVIIPDGPLSQIPFEAIIQELPVHDNLNYRSLKYLLHDYFIGYAYSSASFYERTKRAKIEPSVLAMAFSNDASSGITEFQRIKGAESELKMLSSRLKTGQFLSGIEASEFNFKKLAPSYDIIHLAVHGKGDPEKNNASSLYFNILDDSLEDNELHSYELYGLKLKARLVVLSACESGLGQMYKGEGMMSMASAFAYSGCENILMSLWKVGDQASMALMQEFYDRILEGRSMDEALALTKRHYLQQADELSADPKLWGPMVAYGTLTQVIPDNKKNRIAYLFILMGAMAILFFVYKRLSKKTIF